MGEREPEPEPFYQVLQMQLTPPEFGELEVLVDRDRDALGPCGVERVAPGGEPVREGRGAQAVEMALVFADLGQDAADSPDLLRVVAVPAAHQPIELVL